jgi:hypothetical protein
MVIDAEDPGANARFGKTLGTSLSVRKTRHNPR